MLTNTESKKLQTRIMCDGCLFPTAESDSAFYTRHSDATLDSCLNAAAHHDARLAHEYREALVTSLGNVRSLKAASACSTFDAWEKLLSGLVEG